MLSQSPRVITSCNNGDDDAACVRPKEILYYSVSRLLRRAREATSTIPQPVCTHTYNMYMHPYIFYILIRCCCTCMHTLRGVCGSLSLARAAAKSALARALDRGPIVIARARSQTQSVGRLLARGASSWRVVYSCVLEWYSCKFLMCVCVCEMRVWSGVEVR